jgi:hypothetical protein
MLRLWNFFLFGHFEKVFETEIEEKNSILTIRALFTCKLEYVFNPMLMLSTFINEFM